MLEIKPIQDKNEQEDACLKCGAAYHAEYFCYAAREGDTLLGICQFFLKNETGYIDAIRAADGVSDDDALFLMGRATLNFINLCGIDRAILLDDSDPALSKRIGFSETEDGLFMDLTNFFTAHNH